jgi:hypothetical protein
VNEVKAFAEGIERGTSHTLNLAIKRREYRFCPVNLGLFGRDRACQSRRNAKIKKRSP